MGMAANLQSQSGRKAGVGLPQPAWTLFRANDLAELPCSPEQEIFNATPSKRQLESPHHVVAIGAGLAGLQTVKALAGSKVRVTLMDRKNHHLFQPLVYQVATTILSPD